MGLFSRFKKDAASPKYLVAPYKENKANFIYNLFFCDDLELFKSNSHGPNTYPFDILFAEESTVADLQKIISDDTADPRVKALTYNRLKQKGYDTDKKELLAVIIEVGLENGLDVLGSFKDGTSRYINQTGKILIWEIADIEAEKLTNDLFQVSQQVVNQIGPWDKARLPNPSVGNVRISFIVSGELYFGQGAMNIFFNDAMAGPVLKAATQLMQYITRKAVEKQ